MRMCLWNSRGIKRKGLWTEIEALCKTNNLSILALVETKINTAPQHNWWTKTGFDASICSPAEGRSGGLLILWKTNHFINETLSHKITSKRFVALNYENVTTTFSMYYLRLRSDPTKRQRGLLV